MTKRSLCLLALVALSVFSLSVFTLPAAQAAEHRLGLGYEYWRTVEGLPTGSELAGIEDNGSSWVISYQYRPAGFFTFELDAEIFDNGFGGSTDTAVAPQAFVLVGRGIYGGVGVGFTYSSGLEGDFSDPFFMGRLGINFSFLGPIQLDIHGTYRFHDWEGLQGIDINTDTYTLGAVLRFKI
jgi:hypothetical protein